MSLRNRANQLQAQTDLTYVQALQVIRALGNAPATLAEKWNWSLTRCDAYLYDHNLDADYCAAREVGGSSVRAEECANCWQYFFIPWSHDEGELENRTCCRECSGGGEDEEEERCIRCDAIMPSGSNEGWCEDCAAYVASQ